MDALQNELLEAHKMLIQGRRAFQDICVYWGSLCHSRYHDKATAWQSCEDELCMSMFTVYRELSTIAKIGGNANVKTESEAAPNETHQNNR